MRLVGIILLLLAAMTCALRAEDERGEPAQIDAQKLSFSEENGTRWAVGEGNVVIQYKGAVLRADRAKYNAATKDAWAEGHVRLNRDGQEWVANALQYNFETQIGRAHV